MEKKRRREFMVLFLLIFAVHIFMEIDFNDDQVYTGIIRKKDLWQTLVYSYESGRELFCRYWYSVLYGFLRKFAGGFLWKPVMAGFYTMIPVCIYKLFGEDRSKRSTAVVAGAILLLMPMSFMGETGWLSTAVVYVPPVAFALCGALGMAKAVRGDHLAVWEYPWYLFCVYLGCAHEQLSALLACLFVMVLADELFLQKKRGRCLIFPVLLFLTSAYQLFVAMTWPANEERVLRETKFFFPNYGTLNIIEKIYLAFQETFRVMFRDRWLVPLVLSLVIGRFLWQKYQERLYRVLAVVPAGICLVLGPFQQILSRGFPQLVQLFQVNIAVDTIDDSLGYLAMAGGVWFIGNLLINLYLIWGNREKTWLSQLILLGGFCTRWIMGLSASLYASRQRTFFVLYICMGILIYQVWQEAEKEGQRHAGAMEKGILAAAVLGYLEWFACV